MTTVLLKPFRPALDTKTGRVWTIADRISRERARTARRQEVIDAFVAEGGNPNTASTQYSHWKKHHDTRPSDHIAAPPESGNRVILQIGNDGRLLIPAELRAKMMIAEDGKVLARVEDGELRVIAPKLALRRIQLLVKELDKGQGSVVDELIAERRAEANQP